MNSKNRINWLVVMVVTAIILVLTACGGSSSELVYRVTGTATEVKVAYADADGNTQEETATLPWETSVEVSQDIEFELRVSNNQPTGEIKCEVWLNDRKLGDKDSAAYVVCMGSVHLGNGNPSSFVSYNVEVDLKDALDLMNKGELERALAKVESALDDAPNFASVHYVRGLIYKNMEDPDQALTAYSQAIALDPEYIEAYDYRGQVYGKMGEFELAVADFTAAIELDPEYVYGYFNRAITYANMGEVEAAKADLLKVQELADDPEMLARAEEFFAQLDDAD